MLVPTNPKLHHLTHPTSSSCTVTQNMGEQTDAETAIVPVPPLFMCPISLDLFKDPVTLSTGQTYDRSCIEKWLLAGNLTCPVTMQKLHDTSLVPNHTLRQLIERWVDSSNRVLPDRAVGEPGYSEMKRVIESEESALEDKVRVVEKIESLCQELHKNHCLIKLGILGSLLELVLLESSSEKMGLLEKALGSILKLIPFCDKAALSSMMENETKSKNFVQLFKNGSALVKRSLCLLLEAMGSSNVQELGKSATLVQLLVDDKTEAAIRGLSALSLVESNLENLARNGAVRGLVGYLWSGEKGKGGLEAMAMGVIERLLVVERAKEMLIGEAFGVDVVVKMVFRVSNHEGSESALNSLVVLCCDSEVVREKAIGCGVVTQLLLLLQSQCSVKVKTKARMLLKLLGSM